MTRRTRTYADASLADVPVVSVSYDGDQQLPYWQSFRSCYAYSHQQQFHVFQATEFANDRVEMIRAIHHALRDPAARRPERARAATHFVGGRNEGSIEKLRTALHAMFAEPRA